LTRLVSETGQVASLSLETLRAVFRRPFPAGEIAQQMYRLGTRSLPLVALTTIFTGAVMAMQTAYSMGKYGVQVYVGTFVGLSMVKELGPVLTAVMIAARVGAGIAAELGAMAVSEQVDALRALGSDPVRVLVLPRMAALLLMIPALTMLGITLGVLGGMWVATAEIGQAPEYYWGKVVESMSVGDLLSGLGKSFFFAYFVGIIACFQGMGAHGGASGVGQATTRSVVGASISIFIANFFLSKVALLLQTQAGGLFR
jgi:phospholipid/cholesterol/gamma-HCH transport system permease protein